MTIDLLDLRADGPLLILSFETGSETSKLARKCIAELSTLVTQGGPKKPLVLTSAHGAAVVYRAVPNWAYSLRDNLGRELFAGSSHRFADIKSNFSTVNFSIGDELSEAVFDGTWAGDRTPENVARHQLPVFNDEAASRALTALVERWGSEGHIVHIQRPAASQGNYGGYTTRPSTTPEKDLDPMIRRAARDQRAQDAR
jgi:hypothetical protein